MPFLAKSTFRSLRRRWAAASAAAFLGLALLPTINAPAAYAAAQASAPADVCDYLQFCAYTLPENKGLYQVTLARPQNTCVNLDPELKSQISSLSNRTNWYISLFAGDNCTGASDFIDSGVGYPDLSVQGFDEKLRSFRFDRSYPASEPCATTTRPYLCMYADAGFGGEVQVIGARVGSQNMCVNLQPAFKGQVSSIRNQLPAQDALLFDGDGCTGTSVKVNKGDSSADLGGLNFGDRLRSVKLLPMTTPPPPTPEPCNPAGRNMCLFSEPGFTGLSQLIGPSPVGTCVNLKSTLAGKVSSVQNQLPGQRIGLYIGNNCQSSMLQVEALEQIGDLRTLRFDNVTTSVKFLPPPDVCEYSFQNLCVYADADFTGERQVVTSQSLNTCVNLQTSLQGKVSSVENNTPREVTLYAGLNCTGVSDFISIGVGYPNLTVQGFNDQMRSVKYTPTPR